jgi:hypothetical protein
MNPHHPFVSPILSVNNSAKFQRNYSRRDSSCLCLQVISLLHNHVLRGRRTIVIAQHIQLILGEPRETPGRVKETDKPMMFFVLAWLKIEYFFGYIDFLVIRIDNLRWEEGVPVDFCPY